MISILLYLSVGLIQFLSKFQQGLIDIDKLILKFIWKGTDPRISKTILRKNSKWEESFSPIGLTITKIGVTGRTDTQNNNKKKNRTDNPEIDPHTKPNWFFLNKSSKKHFNRERIDFPTNGSWT